MKKQFIILACLPLFFTGCLTRIVTVAPTPVKTTVVTSTPVVTAPTVVVANPVPVYTTVTTPKVRTVTTATVTPITQDISLYLDLQAVGAAFAQSTSVQAFEQLLNNSSYMLSNLDLNGDGYIDYLRVLETVNGYNHVFLIQAVLGANIYQDVATLVTEIPYMQITKACVQIIGDPFIYGPKYIVQPIFTTTPYIYNRLVLTNYRPYVSPWYWNHYPSCYRRPAPIVLNHYQAYITTYMTNHHYCNKVTYPTQCRYENYERDIRTISRNDYSTQHPEMTFSRRTANVSSSTTTASGRINNASDIRARQAATTTTTTTTSSRSSASTASKPAATASTRSAAATTTSTTPKATTTTTRSTAASTTASKPAATTASSTRSTAASSATATPTTTVTSRVRTSGAATTRTTTTPTSSARSSAASSSSSSSTSRSSAASSSSRR